MAEDLETRENLVSNPPLQSQMIDGTGKPSKPWAIWFRDIFDRTSNKTGAGNPIDDSIGAINDLSDEVEQNANDIAQNASDIVVNRTNIDINTSSIAQNASAIAVNASDIDQNESAISANTLAISNNSLNISQNAADISINSSNISANAQDILNLEHRSLGDSRPLEYNSVSGYNKGDYVVFPTDPQKYYIAIDDILAPAGVFDSTKWVEVSLESTYKLFPESGYGSIALDTDTLLTDISSGSWNTLDFDASSIVTPNNVVYDLATESMNFSIQGQWKNSIKVSLSFDDAASLRKLYLRYYNIDTASAYPGVYTYAVGSNVDVANISVTSSILIPFNEIGDKIVVQISGDSTFTTVEQLGSNWIANHISEIDLT